MTTFPADKLNAIKVVAIQFGFNELTENPGIFMDNKEIVINTLVRTGATGYIGLPMIGKYNAGETDENDISPTIEQVREAIATAFKQLPKYRPKMQHDSTTGKGDAPEIREIVGDKDDTRKETKSSIEKITPENKQRISNEIKPNNTPEVKQCVSTPDITPPEPESAKPVRVIMCSVCGCEIPHAEALKQSEDGIRPTEMKHAECEGKKPEPRKPEIMPPTPKHKPDGVIPVSTVTPKGTIIKGFVPQLAELGKIKIGRKSLTKKTASGIPLPEKLDHFEIVTLNKDKEGNPIPDEVMKQFSEPPKSLNIMLLYNDETLCFNTRYNEYRGGKCMCAGDGETAIRRDGTKVECNPDTCETFIEKKCKLNGILSVFLLDSPRLGGVYKLRTTSFNTVRSILSSLMFIKTVTGGVLAMIPLRLTVTPKTVQPKDSDKAHTIYVVNIEFAGTGQQLLEKVIEVAKHQGAMRAEIQNLESKARMLQAAFQSCRHRIFAGWRCSP